MDPGKRPRGCGARKSSSRCVSGWVNVELNLEPGKCPCGFGARRPRPELPLLGRSPRASVSRWVNVESNLEPVSVPVALAPGGPAQSLPCWIEVFEQVSTWNLTWNPVSAPVAAAPGGPTRSFPCWLEECNLEPGKCPRLQRPEAPPGAPARSFPCWVEVLEQVSPAGSTWNLTWSPLSVPVALAPGGSNKSKLTMNL